MFVFLNSSFWNKLIVAVFLKSSFFLKCVVDGFLNSSFFWNVFHWESHLIPTRAYSQPLMIHVTLL